MKTISTLILALFLACNLASAQDTMYVYRAGTVISKQAVADVDSIIFYKPITPPAVVTDIDGNVYHTLTIGTQTWMVENLKTTKCNDGMSIPNITNVTAWASLTTPGYCFYNNDAANKITYGALYNWYTINTGKLAPIGWHVPTDTEWTTLENYLIANGFNYDGTTTGNKFAKSLAATSGWSTSTSEGVIGNDLTKNNTSGFTGLPGGYRHNNGSFDEVGANGGWWVFTESNPTNAWHRFLNYGNSNLNRNDNGKQYGFSVRCVKDEITPGDATILVAVIDSCQTLADAATTAYYPQAAITTFESALTVAKTAVLDTKITQTEVDNLVVYLRASKVTFLASAYGAIPFTDFLMGLSFDEGAGTQLTADGKGWTAVLKKGPTEIFGTATNFPSFVTGKVGKAMYFSNGSHLEISDYTANDLLGNKLSIAVWVKPDSTRAGNYIMSYNYWNSWKFQLQEQNKPFFTIHTNLDGWVDADNQADFSVPNNAWTHLVVSLDMNTKILTFYVNGAVTMVWDATTQVGLTGTGPFVFAKTLPLMIGACTTYTEALTWEWPWTHSPANWDGFIGAMDELKLYNIALTEGQVSKLYNEEK